MNQLAGIETDQFPGFRLKISHPDMGQPFQTGTKRTLGLPGAPGDAAQFPLVPR
jgi:hypothetical protein